MDGYGFDADTPLVSMLGLCPCFDPSGPERCLQAVLRHAVRLSLSETELSVGTLIRSNDAYYLAALILDREGYLGHGTSIGSAWAEPEGILLYNTLVWNGLWQAHDLPDHDTSIHK